MLNLENILSRFPGIRQTAPDRYTGFCPSHEDKTASLSIRVLPDGTILVNDFGGCATGKIVTDVGLTLADLFPNRPPIKGTTLPPRQYRIAKLAYEDASHLLNFHRADKKSGFLMGRPTKADLESLRLAAGVVREYRRERGAK
jgi:hypothetical protein